MPQAILRRVRASHRGRLLARALCYWSVAAVLVGATLLLDRRAEDAARREATQAESLARIELAQRSLRGALGEARADLHLLAAMGVVGEYLRSPDSGRRAALARDLFAFMATRDWCERVVISTGAGRVVAERQLAAGACDSFSSVVAAFPSSEALLAAAPGAGSPRLCLGLPVGSGRDGARGALMAEADPRVLLADFAQPAPAFEGFSVRDPQGLWLIAPAERSAGRLTLKHVTLGAWSGPSAGSWQLGVSPRSAPTNRAARRQHALVALLLLLASGAGAVLLARAAEARRFAEDDARRQLGLFQTVSDNVPVPIYLKDAAGRYLLCNAAFDQLVGRSRDAILGHDIRALLPPGTTAAHDAVDRAILADGVSRQYETQLAWPDRRTCELLVSKAAVRDDEGRITGLTAALLDISDRKAAEQELRRNLETLRGAQAAAGAGTRAKSEFLAMMSHEMRTPLHAVLGATELLLGGALDHEQREQAAMARAAGQALLDLIDDLLDFSRIEAGRLDLERIGFDVRRLAEDTVSLVASRAAEKGLSLSCEIDADVPDRASGDPGRLRQVLLNLLSNAIEFTEHGEVRAQLGLARRDTDGIVLRLRVRDTGIGIPELLLPRLFEPFAHSEDRPRRQSGGTGLGLAMTRRLVELMGGSIEVASTPGEGSLFTCTVRLGEPGHQEADAQEPSRPPAAPERPSRVLVVEDNRVNQRVTGALLARLGCQVDVASDGREALEAVARCRYDLVLMDCRMPGMNGYDASREIRRREGDGPHVPIVALTAHALRGDRERCLAAGMTDYLAKPIDLASLERALLRHAHTGDQPATEVAAATGASLVDAQALASLQSLERDGPGFLVTLVREFDESARQRLGDMQLAARGGDGELLRGAAHSLKGSAGIFGARGMTELCRRLEDLAGEELGVASPLIARLAHEHQAVMSVLQEAATSA